MNIITIPNLSTTLVEITQDAQHERDNLLSAARFVETVRDSEEVEIASDVLKQCTAFARQIEAQRKDAVAPVLTLTKQINDLAKQLLTEIDTERNRLGGLVAAYQQAEAAKAAKALADARAKEEAAHAKAMEEVRAAQAAGADTEYVDQVASAAIATVIEAKAAVVAAAPVKLAGLSTKEVINYEITDAAALYAAHPMFLKLVPIDTLIRAALKQGPLPGVKSWKTSQTIVRG